MGLRPQRETSMLWMRDPGSVRRRTAHTQCRRNAAYQLHCNAAHPRDRVRKGAVLRSAAGHRLANDAGGAAATGARQNLGGFTVMAAGRT